MNEKKRGLGRGLADLGLKELLSRVNAEPPANEAECIRQLLLAQVQPSRFQPRREFDEELLQELANSISTQGVIQPIIVRRVANSDGYEIIAGERRWRAAKLAKLERIPAIVCAISDDEAMIWALIENIQREDLNALEEAHALQRLHQEFGLTHQQVAETVGKSRATVSNLLRLLLLNDDVKLLVERGDLDMGHARCLLALSGQHQSTAAQTVVARGLSVRETEALVRKILTPPEKRAKVALARGWQELQQQVAEQLSTKVRIVPSTATKGKVVIHYSNAKQLEELLKTWL